MKIKKFIPTGLLFLIFIVFTFVVKFADVSAIGPNGSEVGLASLNGLIAGIFSYSDFCYKITKIIALFSFMYVFFFAFMGIWQLIRGKSFKKVDTAILGLGGLYVITALFYVLFEVLVINFRPILVDGELEASFPSTHTMLAVTILGSACVYFIYRLKKPQMYVTANIVLIVMMAVCRLISGVHWCTDIIGGVILGCALISLYLAFMQITNAKPDNTEQ